MASEIFLYWGSGSPPCWRVQICLEEKGLHGYGNKLIEFSKKEHKSEEIMKLNPRGQAPTFRHGDIVLNESMGIIQYLETVFKDQGTQLLPQDPKNLAKVLQRFYETLNLQKAFGDVWYHYMGRNTLSEEKLNTAIEDLRKEIQRWEDYFGEGNSFIAGEQFSLADAAFFPQLAIMFRVGFKAEEKYPKLFSYYSKLCERPSIKTSWPPHWKDSKGPDKLAHI